MAKPKRTFTAQEGQKATGSAGPEPLKRDLDAAFAMFDPEASTPDEDPGGIGEENLQATLLALINAGIAKVNGVEGGEGREITLVEGNNVTITADEEARTITISMPEELGLLKVNGVSGGSGREITLVAGPNVSITPNAANRTITIGTSGEIAPSAHAATHASGGNDPISPASIGAETPSGAQTKADGALAEAKSYADGALAEAKSYTDQQVGGITPASIGAETPVGAQGKANAALQAAKDYTDQKVGEVWPISSTAVANPDEQVASGQDGGLFGGHLVHLNVGDTIKFWAVSWSLAPDFACIVQAFTLTGFVELFESTTAEGYAVSTDGQPLFQHTNLGPGVRHVWVSAKNTSGSAKKLNAYHMVTATFTIEPAS